MGGAAGMLTMRRLQAPARHEPDIDQHHRRVLCPSLRETSAISRTAPLPSRYEAVWRQFLWYKSAQPQSFDWT
jgi:hypothetical protein